jgi:Flp pilus assembly protein TadG
MRKPRRRGAATVEFAVVAPVFLLFVLGVLEFGRAMMVAESVNNAARASCRVGVLVGRNNTEIENAIKGTLGAAGISTYTYSVKVNGTVANASTAKSGDSVTVTVSTPYDRVSWLPINRFLSGVNLTSSVVMRRE